MKKEKNRHSLMVRFLKRILMIFFKKPKIIQLCDDIDTKAIYVSNHSGASGPITLSIFFPKFFAPWGTHEMCGKYKERWKYMYHTFYLQKKGYSKLKAFIAATVVSLFSKYLYNAMGLIPTYTDARLKNTIDSSIKVIDDGKAVLIFPENSQQGYKEVLEEYFGGFAFLSNLYYKKRKIDLPVYNIYYSSKTDTIVIDKPQYIQKFISNGYTLPQIANIFKDRANVLKNQAV
ncbi:MAG: hypothetical protein PHE12_04535 [Clostridia bacterium]|nr:hypothetical protein [Clostridia bacterium]